MDLVTRILDCDIRVRDIDSHVVVLNHEGCEGIAIARVGIFGNQRAVVDVEDRACRASRTVYAFGVDVCPALEGRTFNGHVDGVEGDDGIVGCGCVIRLNGAVGNVNRCNVGLIATDGQRLSCSRSTIRVQGNAVKCKAANLSTCVNATST